MSVRKVSLLVLPIVALSLVPAAPSLFADPQESARSYSLPLAEAEAVISRWLAGTGLDVSRTAAGDGKVLVKGRKGGESWEIELAPNSPLAFSVRAGCSRNGEPCPDGTSALWAFLKGYASGGSPASRSPEQEVPSAVLARKAAVVCIRAGGGNGAIQFSGFFVGREGLILATAHDLGDARKVSVILGNGEEREGRLVKIDRVRDLSLIDIGSTVDASVPLSSRRGGLRAGETVYSVGCPENRPVTVLAGVVDGPQRVVSDLPLWQVNIETMPGGSGSPVFDVPGNLVGVVKGRFRGTESRGFLIPVGTVLEFLGER